jgi:uncharacterized protein YegP (UPF0339 family)
MYRDNRGEWRWRYDASNAKTIAVSSEGYVRRVDCRRGIDLMKNSGSAEVWIPNADANAS